MRLILYKFLTPEFAIKVLEEKRLKVSLVSELNDIYDWHRFSGLQLAKRANASLKFRSISLTGSLGCMASFVSPEPSKVPFFGGITPRARRDSLLDLHVNTSTKKMLFYQMA